MAGDRVAADGGSGWLVSLRVPLADFATFEIALNSLGGGQVIGAVAPDGLVPVELYLAAEPDPAAVTAALSVAAAATDRAVPDFTLSPLPAVDWVAERQKALPPLTIGRFYVHGSHVTAPPPAGRIAILIDAATAFGTGRHETTRGCLLALGDLAKHSRPRRPLDMGCGSGLLAIAMAKLWPVPVLAVDNDRPSVRVARANAGLNRVAGQVRSLASEGFRAGAVARRGPFDLIVANILAGPLQAMASDLTAHLAPRGRVVLSGLLAEQQQAVRARYRVHGLHLLRRYRIEDWVTLLLAR